MILHEPFIITGRLHPGLKIGSAFLSLLDTEFKAEGETCLGRRQSATMVLDFTDGAESYEDSTLQSGCGGFQGVVAIFETYLSFLLAAVEGYEYEQRSPGRKSDNSDLFPTPIVQWAVDNKSEIEYLHCELQDENGDAREELVVIV